MYLIYFERPILLIIPALLLLLQLLSRLLEAPLWLTAISCVLHAVGIALLIIFGGTLEDALVLVLLSGAVGLLSCPIPGGGK